GRAARLAAWRGIADLVFLDVPCTGSGTWRRNPDLRWRHDASAVADLQARQARLIDEARDLLCPGGRLVYATCSLLTGENEAQVAAACARHPALRLEDYRRTWRRIWCQSWPSVPSRCPDTASHDPSCLLLTPARHGTDGFFVAVLRLSEPVRR
ncbi:MAG: MFS transporter, partial [Alphaproteobacteria bacterium]